MTPGEAKFILRAHREDGRYSPDDPVFRAALAEVEKSPELAEWLAREHALDATVANKLDGIQPPAGLRETILAGAKASRLHRPAWRQPRWLALAASIAIVATLSLVVSNRRDAALSAGAFAHLAVDKYAHHVHDHNYSGALAAIARDLGARTTPLTAGLDLSPEQLRAAHCTALTLGDREAYELCFERNGAWFHLYVTKLDRAGHPEHDRRPILLQKDQFAAAAWSDGKNLYSVVTRAGSEALVRLI